MNVLINAVYATTHCLTRVTTARPVLVVALIVSSVCLFFVAQIFSFFLCEAIFN